MEQVPRQGFWQDAGGHLLDGINAVAAVSPASGTTTGLLARTAPNAVVTTSAVKSAKELLKQGRSGKQERLVELANDAKISSSDRGWIKQEMNEIAQGKRQNIRNPPGKDLAHERGREAAKGYSYQHSNLQDRDLHRRQHKYDDYGRKNKERPLQP
ncbi:polymorphic toxin type 8 domain-containing protein [Runella sp. MFBS21]|uniref:polymorphic toxin type 8 domain-containing protein n=1 Tax=Runella sp. MFBS21 TaxID=3034018 RepID=UPI0023F666D4|nr:polymorphic toxin type 8 domain-containing protein [Runella sp. MFBS21]MDF7822269.1 polymorphic toxin type 8 domain-containing protein [Runella sp. MFBS21]